MMLIVLLGKNYFGYVFQFRCVSALFDALLLPENSFEFLKGNSSRIFLLNVFDTVCRQNTWKVLES